MPKSGSTFLSSTIAALPGFSRVDLVPIYGRREQELCVQALREHHARVGGGSYVAQHHVRYSVATELYIKEFALRPIVLVRNIFDVVPSLVDHHSLEGHEYPAAFAPSGIAEQSFENQAHFVTQMAIPWYFNFYMSWHECKDKHVVIYDDLISRPEFVLRGVSEYLGLNVSDQEIDSAIAQVNATGRRKNKVSPGRGKGLPPEDIAKIIQMANHYPDVDFSDIGIPADVRTAKSDVTRVFWLTGLPGAGKTTLARALKSRFDRKGIRSVILDGDELREGISANLGFSDEDRSENVRRVAEIASLFQRNGIIPIVALVSPTPTQREIARRIIDKDFIEVFVDTPIEVCESRDPKGHYRRARQGRITGFTGVSAAYIPPVNPEITVRTTLMSVDNAVNELVALE